MIASYLRKMLTLACVAAVLPACLITERKDYQPAPSLPPSIVTTSAFPVDQIIRLDPGADGGVGELRFDVIVREPNINDRVEARVLVRRPDTAATNIPVSETVPLNLTADKPGQRPFEFVLSPGTLAETGCNRIELVVASEFTGSRPVEPDESANVVWWAGPDGADMRDCPR